MLNILIADRLPAKKVEEMSQLVGVSCTYQPDLSAEQLADVVEPVHVLCVRSTKVQRAVIERANDLMLILRVGSGVNTIDLEAASERGIYVANCPGKNATAVAELTIGFMVAMDRRIPQATASLYEHRWEKKEFSKADGLKGKRLGIVGLGQIGLEVAQRAKAFEMEVMAYSYGLTKEVAESHGVFFCDSLELLCRESDILTVHVPFTPETKHLFHRERFAQMKENAFFINTSRGGIHDQEALLEAMNTKGLRAALDVFEKEPASGDNVFEAEILRHPNFIGTPHIGASTKQAQVAVAEEAIRVVREFLEKGRIVNCVNLQKHTSVQVTMSVRHYNKVGVLASVMDLLRTYDINIEGMNNTIFQEGKAAVATMELSNVPPDELIQQIEEMKNKIIQVTLSHQPR